MWVDIIIVALCAGAAAIEAKRGFFPAALDLVGLTLVALVVTRYGSSLAGAGLSPTLSFALMYVFLAAAVVTAAKFINDATKFDIGAFDHPLGGVIGFFVGVAVSYALVEMLRKAGVAAATSSILAAEVHEFRTFSSIVSFLRGLGNRPQPGPVE
jgi:hypothetical protein